jgi:hypothetical protein
MLEDMATRQSEKNKITEQDGGCAETVAQQISRKIRESQGYLDM